MALPGGPEVLVGLALVLLVVLALPAGYVVKWVREGYEDSLADASDPESGG